MKRPLGCLSRSGIVTALVILILVVGVAIVWGGRLFSPGPLHAQTSGLTLGGVGSHAETGGRCTACHPAPWSQDTMSDRCLACHVQIEEELGDPNRLHGALLATADTRSCQACHLEHRGPEAGMTIVDPNNFPHDATGFSLQGHGQLAAGRTFSCIDCHGLDFAQFDRALCGDCHSFLDAAYTQAHVDTFGPSCLDCHDGVDRYGAEFDHNGLAFPLQGAHALLDCASCHQDAHSPTDLQGTPQDCYSCHQEDDAHEGRFGQDCAQCHTTEDWTQAEFDHDLAAFALTGRHITVDCQECHTGGVYRGTPQDCYSCHQDDDAHEGRFGQDCAQCHTPEGWDQAEFDHDLAAFALTGAHVAVDCQECHTGGVYRGTPQDCYSCHQEDDAHEGRFGQDCAQCHTTEDWTQAEFDHDLVAFALTGAHVAVDCQECHTGGVYRGTPQDCYSCHQDGDAHEGRFGQDCAQCHTPEGWDQAEFDHDLAAFALTGAHVSVACTNCHVDNVFRGTPQVCAACHQDPAFHAGLLGTDCAACHTAGTWTPANYSRPHTFPLTHGEGGANPCRTCHPETLAAYTCYTCHEHDPAEIEQEHRDEGIADFQDCVRCHPSGEKEEGEEEDND